MRIAYTLLALLSLLVLSCRRAEPPSDPALVSATRFVAAFYKWYLPSAQKGSGLQVATRDSAALFAPALVSALEADADAQSRSPGAVVGLDGDPFLDAQEFCDAYLTDGARHQGDTVLVEVHGNCSGRTETVPDVIAALTRTDSNWVFVNFRYPRRNSDLIKDLDELRRARNPKS